MKGLKHNLRQFGPVGAHHAAISKQFDPINS